MARSEEPNLRVVEDDSEGTGPPAGVMPDILRVNTMVRFYYKDGEKRYDGQVTVGRISLPAGVEIAVTDPEEHASALICATELLDRYIEASYPGVYKEIEERRLKKIAGEE